jgi:hypothetical protein
MQAPSGAFHWNPASAGFSFFGNPFVMWASDGAHTAWKPFAASIPP